MKKKLEAHASIVSRASPEDIYALILNSATYPFWTMIERYESLRSGRAGLHDVGAVRTFRTGSLVMKEEIIEAVQDERVSYTLLSGFPMLDYRSTTSLAAVPGGTLISWTSSFHPKYPMTGWFWRGLMNRTLNSMVRGLASAAEDQERRRQILKHAQSGLSNKSDMPGAPKGVSR